MKKKRNKIIGVLAVILLLGAAVVGVWAYLQVESDPVTNTFAAADLLNPEAETFVLIEHKAVQQADGSYTLATGYATADLTNENSYKVVPGVDLPKDPYITVDLDNEDDNLIQAYLFIEVIDTLPEAINFTDDSTNGGWEIDHSKWSKLMDGTSQVTKDNHPVWVYTPAPGATDPNIFADDHLITTDDSSTVINNSINIMKQDTNGNSIIVPGDFDVNNLTTATKLDFKAYLTQAAGFTDALDAWSKTYADAGGSTTP